MILVVDDEPMVLGLLERILARLGFRVLIASTAAQALDLFWKYAVGLRLLLVDIILPGTNGVDFIEALPTLRPRIPVLFMSAYGEPHLSRSGILESGHSFLRKPFTIAELLTAIRGSLPSVPLMGLVR